MSENKLRDLVNEIITKSTIADSPITFEFKETTRGFGEEYSVFLRHPDFEKHVGYVQVIQYWDHFDNIPKDTVIKGKGVRIFTVESTFIDKKFRGEGLGSQMYKFLIANLSKLEIALVPAEWVEENDSVVTYDNEEEPRGPLNRGQHGTSNLALNVWKNFKIPAFYPEWNPDDFNSFQSTRKRGWKDKIDSKRNHFPKEDF